MKAFTGVAGIALAIAIAACGSSGSSSSGGSSGNGSDTVTIGASVPLSGPLAGFGARLPVLGPIENADLVGLDLTLAIHEYVLPELDPPSQPSPGLRRRVEQGRLGMKTGSGFRSWSSEDATAVRERLLAHLIAMTSDQGGGGS